MSAQLTVGGRTFGLPYADQVRPLTSVEYDCLREGIVARGIDVAIVVDDDDNVIDGHNRLAIAAELGITDVPLDVRRGLRDDQKRNLANALNEERRQFSRAEQEERARARRERVMKAKEEGKSQVQIAAEEGVSTAQIHRDMEPAGTFTGVNVPADAPRIRRRNGVEQKQPRPARAGMGERVRACIAAHPDWTTAQIAEALDVHRSYVNSVRRQIAQEAAKLAAREGPAQTEPPAGRPRRGPDLHEAVLAVIRQHPDWTYERVAKAAGVSASCASGVGRAERRRREQEAAASTPSLGPEVRQKITAAGLQRQWDSSMVEQALANVADPEVPQWRKDDLLAGRSDPLIYTSDRRLVPMRASLMEPANPDYAPIATALDRVRSALHALQGHDAPTIRALLSEEARRDWLEYRGTTLRRHLEFVDSVLLNGHEQEGKRAGCE